METQDYLSFPASTAPTSLSILQLVKMRLALESTVQQDTGLLARANSNDASGSVDGSITGSKTGSINGSIHTSGLTNADGVNHNSTKTLWMGDLAPFMDEAFLHALFAPTKQLVSVKVIRNKLSGASEGYAFVELNTHEAAECLLNGYNGKVIPGTNSMVFRLNWAAYGVGRSSQPTNEDFSLFVGDVAPDVSDFILQEYFRQFYPSVRSAKVITDATTGRSKGYGFVRFSSESERNAALTEMNGHFLSNRPIRVSLATAKKNVTNSLGSQAQTQMTYNQSLHPSELDPTNTTLFIGGLGSQVMEEQLRAVFGQFGEIIYVKIPHGKGCGFVQFVLRTAAERAIVAMNGKVLGNSAMRISWGRSSSRSNSLTGPGALPQVGFGVLGGLPDVPATPTASVPSTMVPTPSQLHSSLLSLSVQQLQQQSGLSGFSGFSGLSGVSSLSGLSGAASFDANSAGSSLPDSIPLATHPYSFDSRSVSSYNTTGPSSSMSEPNASPNSLEQASAMLLINQSSFF